METRGGKWGSSLRRAGGSGSDLETGSARQLRACLGHLRKLRQGQGVPSPYPCPSCGVRSLFWQFRSHSCIFFFSSISMHTIQGDSSWLFEIGNINGHFERVPERIRCTFSLLLLPSVVLQSGGVGVLAEFSDSALSHTLWRQSLAFFRNVLSHGNVPNVLKWKNSECFTEHILYIPEQKYFFIVNNIFS